MHLIGKEFGPVEEEITKAFLPALFEGVGDGAPGREITLLPVKQAGMALPDPTFMASERWHQVSCDNKGRLPVLRGRQSWIWEGHPRLLHRQAGDFPPWGTVPDPLSTGHRIRQIGFGDLY